MKKVIPVEKNMDYIIDINGFGYEGEGVGKIEDFTIFVQGALKGEKVKVRIVKVNKNFAFAKLIEIIEPSKDRVQPACSIYKMCGGCQIQHLSYEAQLNLKKQRVKDCLTRIGKIDVIEDAIRTLELDSNDDKNIKSNGAVLHNTLGMERQWRYRNKVQLPIRDENGEIKIGFYAERSHKIINLDTCLIQGEIADKVVELTKAWAIKHNIKPYNEDKGTGSIRHIMIREAFKTGEVMIVLVTNGRELKAKDEFIKLMIDNVKGLTSIVQNINTKNTNVILGLECITLWGKSYITDYIGKFKFNISPLSFFQVNPIQTEVLYSKALEYADLTGNEVVFDAYCGAGTISLFLSQKAKKVYGVEIIPEAIENAVQNAKENGVDNAEFIVGESEKVIPELISKGIKADVVVVDPPRKGCDKVLLEAIAKMKPQRIVYVSCDPGTLGRDLGILEELGYETVEVQPVDMFPETGHVETVVRLSHKNADGFISVKMEYEEGVDRLPERVTYSMIQAYVEGKYGFRVHTAYIAEVKRSLGLPMYVAPNAVDVLKNPYKPAPAHKVEAIKDALKHFEVI